MRWKILFLLWLLPVFSNELEERITALEMQMGEVGERRSEGTFGARFAPETFQKGWIGVFFSGSALYWHTKVGESEYAYTWAYNAITGKELQKKEVEATHFDWDLGYRLEGGVRLTFIGWDLTGTYTHYGSKGASSERVSHHAVNYDSADVELRGSSFLSRFFGIQTFLGGRGVWIDQQQTLLYLGESLKERCRFQGVGPRFGGRLKWNLLCGVSFLTNISASTLYGDFQVKHFEDRVSLEGESKIFSANLGFLLGVGWDMYTSGYHFGVSLGYEAEYYWRQNRLIDVVGIHRVQIVRSADDLTFYGVTLKGVIEF